VSPPEMTSSVLRFAQRGMMQKLFFVFVLLFVGLVLSAKFEQNKLHEVKDSAYLEDLEVLFFSSLKGVQKYQIIITIFKVVLILIVFQ
jgi:hypothetical protein